MIEEAFGREPRPDEIERLVAVAGRCGDARGVAAGEQAATRVVWKDVAHAIFLAQEFSHVE